MVEATLDTARRAGAILMEKFRRLERVEKKGKVDLVTEADLASEREIVTSLRRAFPDHAIIAEEGDYDQSTTSPHRWVIDPLDGTTNYVHGLPTFAVSIGYQRDGSTEAGVVINPAQGEEYVAVKSRGATLNGQPIQVSKVKQLAESLLVTGFPYSHDEVFSRTFDLYHAFHLRCQGVRRLGAAALDFCYVAAGRLDAFYEANLNPWDVCAGDLICREAGGRTTDWLGGPMPFDGRRILASNGTNLHEEMLEVLNLPEFAVLR
ncbi:MAG: inositol monophosphatase [Fidelibacterota bacterium]|nr:MAG: inositol monophosphatase [Candidatus Neomarinimicrobiota bacterium]